MIVESQIDDLHIRTCKLRRVSVSVIKQLVMRMKRLEISCWGLTKDDRVVVINSIRQSPQLVSLKLHNAHYLQLSGLFNYLMETDQPTLKHLTITALQRYDPATVATSLSKLESVVMYGFVPPAILTMLAEKLQSGSRNLKELRLDCDVSEEVKKIFQESLKFIQE